MGRSLRARIGVKALILREGRVLLLRRSAHSPQYPGYWDLPGGGVEERETLEQALRREVKEETRLRVRVGTLVHAAILTWPLDDGTLVPSLGVTFACAIGRKAVPHLSLEEHSEFAWVDRKHLSSFRMSRLCAEAVRAGFLGHRPIGHRRTE
jgi:8-oxo-dGTP diphosphatase